MDRGLLFTEGAALYGVEMGLAAQTKSGWHNLGACAQLNTCSIYVEGS